MRRRTFAANGATNKTKHFYVEPDLTEIIKKIEAGSFFACINPSQTGKTTLMAALYNHLKDQYTVINMHLPKITEDGMLFTKFVTELELWLSTVHKKTITIVEESLFRIFHVCNNKVLRKESASYHRRDTWNQRCI
jgi:ABC-type uncharacterized transport system YnjBCD ATPase subunit